MTARETQGAERDLPAEWGAVYDGRTLALSIQPPATAISLERVRFGRTVLDLRARTRPAAVVVQLAVRFGPPLPVRIELAGKEERQILVDEHVIEGRAARFVASHEHEVQFLAASC